MKDNLSFAAWMAFCMNVPTWIQYGYKDFTQGFGALTIFLLLIGTFVEGSHCLLYKYLYAPIEFGNKQLEFTPV